ncbi:prenyltransferase [Enterococcus sp. LJL98]
MRFKQFWELAEVYTAPLNLFLVLLGWAYGSFQYGIQLNAAFFLYVLTILLFHLAVNIFNHYMDYQNASDDHDYKEKSNIIGRDQLSLKLVRWYFVFFMAASCFFGLLLVWQTSLWLLIPGMLGFYIGLFYSSGPRPLNSLPIAETITSLASGYLVPFVAFYVLTFDRQESLLKSMDGNFFLVCLPLVLMMFNNLIANNTCDLEEDIVNHRQTLVYYIGKKNAVGLLRFFLMGSFLLLPVLVIVDLSPWPVLLLLLFLPKLLQGLRPYFAVQEKQRTFPLVLKTMSVMMIGYPCLYFIGVIFRLSVH